MELTKDSTGAEIYQAFVASGIESQTEFWQQHAQETGLTFDAVHGHIWRQRQIASASKIIQLDAPKVDMEPPLPTLDSLSDRDRWQHDLKALLTNNATVTVMHPCDRHAPYTDTVADEMWYTLASLIQPDIVVRGSDEDDLPTISHFAEDGAPEPEIDDFLDVMYRTRRYHTRRTKLVVPHALQVNIEGNHGYSRFIRWVNKKAKESKTNLLRQYIQNIRCDGMVYYIGMKQSVRINAHFIVMHGRRAGTHAAKATLDMRHSSISIICGHTHRPDMYSVVSAMPVTAVVSGCLCLIPQNYNADEDDDYAPWQHGTAVATIDTASGLVDIKEVRFHRKDNRAWFEWGGKVYTFDVSAIAQKAA